MPDTREFTTDELIAAVRLVVGEQFASTSFVQRHLKIGHAVAADIMSELERRGAVGPAVGSRAREVLKRTFETEGLVREIRRDAAPYPAAGRDLIDPQQLTEAERIVYSAIPFHATGFDHRELARTAVGLLADHGWRPTRPAAG